MIHCSLKFLVIISYIRFSISYTLQHPSHQPARPSKNYYDNEQTNEALSSLSCYLKNNKCRSRSQLLAKNPVASSQAESQRVVSDSNVPVRQQIAWAKAKKRLASMATSSHSAPKYRKEKTKKKRIEDDNNEVYIDYEKIKPPVIFVDGYNVIGYLKQKEKKSFDDLSAARDGLINDLGVLRSATGWLIEVVFDAYQSNTGTERSEFVNNVIVTYTGKSETADNHIERRFEELKKKDFTNMVVCTDDNMLRMVAGSSGTGFLSCANLLEEFRIAYRGWENMESEMADELSRRQGTVGDGLTDEMQAVISSLKAERVRAEAAHSTVKAAETAAKKAKKAGAKQARAVEHDCIRDKSGHSDGDLKGMINLMGIQSDRMSQKERKKLAQVSLRPSAMGSDKNMDKKNSTEAFSLQRHSVGMGISEEMQRAIELLRQREAEAEEGAKSSSDSDNSSDISGSSSSSGSNQSSGGSRGGVTPEMMASVKRLKAKAREAKTPAELKVAHVELDALRAAMR